MSKITEFLVHQLSKKKLNQIILSGGNSLNKIYKEFFKIVQKKK